jgi:sortase A
VDYNQTAVNQSAFLLSLHDGVVHYPNTALPGEQGNIVIFGHSSGQWWAPGHYKFVFTLLDKLTTGDRIILDYKGQRYIYKVTDTKVVLPNDLSVLNKSGNNILTLITCTPVGTSQKRLIVHAQQIVPNPSKSSSSTTSAPNNSTQPLPGNNSSFWQDFKDLL